MPDKKGTIKLVTYEEVEEKLRITIEPGHTLSPAHIQTIQLTLKESGPFILTIVKK